MLASAENPYLLSCEEPLGSNRFKSEGEFLKQAPHGAKRTSKHILEIKFSAGVKEFIDKPPYDDPDYLNTEGIAWSYCGYNKVVDAHLIVKRDELLYTGSLLFEASGKVIKAGNTVVFSPNKQNFIAFTHLQGGDIEQWDLWDIYGHKLWSGFSYIVLPLKPTDSYPEVAEFDNPTLSDNLQIDAHVKCMKSNKTGSVTLKESSGKSIWPPKIECDL